MQDHQRDWDKYVTLLLMVYRTAIHNPMKLSPARLMMGHEIRTPIELIYGRPDYETRETYSCNAQGLQKNLERAHELARTNLEFNYNVDSTTNVFDQGELVWFYNPRRRKGRSVKLTQPWEGLSLLFKSLNDFLYRIQQDSRTVLDDNHWDNIMTWWWVML